MDRGYNDYTLFGSYVLAGKRRDDFPRHRRWPRKIRAALSASARRLRGLFGRP